MHDGHLIQSSECGTAIKEYADDVLDHPVWDLTPKATFDFNDRTALSGIIDQVYDYEAGGLGVFEKHSFKGCSGRNEAGYFEGGSLESCSTRCSTESTCISFEYFTSGSNAQRCQLSTSCTGALATESKYNDLYIKLSAQPKCRLSGFSHWRDYAKGFLRNNDNDDVSNAKAVISNLEPNVVYSFKVFQYASQLGGSNGLIVNSQSKVTTTSSISDLPSHTGTATASVEGKIIFEFVRESQHVHLSKIEIHKQFSLDACKAACVDPGNKDPNHDRPCVAVEHSTTGECRLAYSCDSPAGKVGQDIHLLPELVFLEMYKRDTETSFANKTTNGYYVMQTSAAYPGMCGSAPISTSNQLVLMVNAPASVRIYFLCFSFFSFFFFFCFIKTENKFFFH